MKLVHRMENALIAMVYSVTTPRRPVAASFTGPGPCYGLPGLIGQSNHDPRSAFCRAPAYHILGRSVERVDGGDFGPGPCYLPQPKVYRNGREVTPQCRIVNRRPDLVETVGPGPAAYGPVRFDLFSKFSRSPAYTIPRARSSPSRPSKDVTPGETTVDDV